MRIILPYSYQKQEKVFFAGPMGVISCLEAKSGRVSQEGNQQSVLVSLCQLCGIDYITLFLDDDTERNTMENKECMQHFFFKKNTVWKSTEKLQQF